MKYEFVNIKPQPIMQLHVLLLPLTAFVMAYRSPLLLTILLIIYAIFVVINRRVLCSISGFERKLLISLFWILSLALPFALVRNLAAILHYFVILFAIGSSYIITRSPYDYLNGSRLALYAGLLTVLLYLYYTGLNGFPLDDLIEGSSRNGITAYLIVLQVNYCISNYLIRDRLSFFTPLLTLFICIVGYGRGSILSAFFIIIINFIILIFTRVSAKNLLIISVVVLLSGWSLFTNYESIVYFLNYKTKMGSGLHDASRHYMFDQYIEILSRDTLTIFTGADFSGTVIESEFNNNPHNSYMRAHHIFGLPYLIFVLLTPFLAASFNKKKIGALLFFSIFLFRATTDTVLFPTLLDVFYFGAIFLLSNTSEDLIK
jgi:hypothetical protein